jgi:hypothetical protein
MTSPAGVQAFMFAMGVAVMQQIQAREPLDDQLFSAAMVKKNEGDDVPSHLLKDALKACREIFPAYAALQGTVDDYQRACKSAAQVTAAAADLLRAHGVRRERAAQLRKAAAALGIAAAAVADADAAAVVKQSLELHCIDHTAVSGHQAACEECRRLYRELLQLCSKLGLPAPPGAPPAAADVSASGPEAAQTAAAPASE